MYELANGAPVEYEYGSARVALMGQETVVQIIFGSDDAEPILGVGALETGEPPSIRSPERRADCTPGR